MTFCNAIFRCGAVAWLGMGGVSLALATGHAVSPTASAELTLQGSGPYYTLDLSMALQGRASTSTLQDVQVVNARGDALAFAWVQTGTEDAERSSREVPIFKVPGAASGVKAGPPNRWMLDARQIGGSLLSVELELPESVNGVYTLAVEASDDLQRWVLLDRAAEIVALQHGGQRLTSHRLDLGGVRAGYLRLTAAPQSLLPELKSATVTGVAKRMVPRPLQWSDPIAPIACGTFHCDYSLPRNVPLEQLQVQLSEPNTLGDVTVLAAAAQSKGGPAQQRSPSHNPIRALHQKTRPADPVSAVAWLPLASNVVYRLARPDRELHSAPFWLSGGVYQQLRLQTVGPLTQLGPTPPRVRVGTHTRTLVFLARGPAPYRLSWGHAQPTQLPMNLQQLLPTRGVDEPLPTDRAVAQEPVATIAAASAPSSAPRPTTVATSSASSRPADRPAWLWAILVAGLSMMGFMAWSLLRGSPARSAPES